ncbi:MAG TPA: hypothetical protein VGB25_05730 [Candidatus Binatia bacterium]
MEGLMERVCEVEGVSVQGVKGGGRRAELCRVREGIAYLWVEYLGRSGRQLAVPLGVRAESVYKAVRRGQLEGKRWESCWNGNKKSHKSRNVPYDKAVRHGQLEGKRWGKLLERR